MNSNLPKIGIYVLFVAKQLHVLIEYINLSCSQPFPPIKMHFEPAKYPPGT